MVGMPVSNNGGTGNRYAGPITALNGIITSTAVGTANNTYIAEIDGIFVAQTSGNIFPRFRSETNGRQVIINAGSVVTFKEY
jgi:hypothetical protein